MNEKAVLAAISRFPKTRYQGSKYKLLRWLSTHFARLDAEFDTCLDAFGGTGAVSYLLKAMNKRVIYNDALHCNAMFGKALIENPSTRLTEAQIDAITRPHPDRNYDDFIARTFANIYFTEEENRWLDITLQNILAMEDAYAQAMAFWALSQAALSKRPYNLFHRKNLYVRTANVKRSFGNKKTWDRPFDAHFRNFASQANAAIFDNGRDNQAYCEDALTLSCHPTPDLIYIDPPYIPAKGSLTRYRDFYHFLEGMLDYARWSEQIDYTSKHRKLRSQPSPWEDKAQIYDAFEMLFKRYHEAILVVSYRRDGVPSIDEIADLMRQTCTNVEVHAIDYQYTLSTRQSQEVLMIGTR